MQNWKGMKIGVLHNQSLLDIAISYGGNISVAFAIALENGISVTDDLQPGRLLAIPENIAQDVEIVNYYRSRGIHPATAVSYQNVETQPEGIEYWAIEMDFVVM